MVRVGGRGGRTNRVTPRCSICTWGLGYHKVLGREGRLHFLCNRHHRIGSELCRSRDDWEAYVVITQTFGDVEVPNAFPE